MICVRFSALRAEKRTQIVVKYGSAMPRRTGIFMIPTAIKCNHVRAAHTEADIDQTLEVARGAALDARRVAQQGSPSIL
jgi:glutamate-1-semialdehyde aminotransferase